MDSPRPAKSYVMFAIVLVANVGSLFVPPRCVGEEFAPSTFSIWTPSAEVTAPSRPPTFRMGKPFESTQLGPLQPKARYQPQDRPVSSRLTQLEWKNPQQAEPATGESPHPQAADWFLATESSPVESAPAESAPTESFLVKSPPAERPVQVAPPIGFPNIHGPSAATECDAEAWMAPYLARAGEVPAKHPTVGVLPSDYVPWWDRLVREDQGVEALAIHVDWLVQSALQHAPSVRAVLTEPRIRQSAMLEESAAFDWRSFLETTYDDLNDPVGNTLTTGNNADRFTDKTWSTNAGFRRRNSRGGEFEISQRLGRQSNNSIFLIPNPQATTRMQLNYSQPLLNGRGRPYNMSRIVLARIDRNASRDEVVIRLQDHLLKVTEAYWDLYRFRARYFQRLKLLEQARQIANNLAAREQVDALYRQVLRAEAAVARRTSEIVRAATQIRNAEAQLRLLVNDPALIHMTSGGLTPMDPPSMDRAVISMSDSLATALAHRPDISRAIRNMRANNVRLGVARHEILPQLDLFVSSYVAGLASRSRVYRSLGDQFSEGRPGLSVGLQYEMPIGNRAAIARVERRRWEFARAIHQFQATVENALTEVELAVREVHTTFAEMVGKYHAMMAAKNETDYLADRFQTLPGTNDSATLLLEDLLDSQERLADEEAAFADAQVQYSTNLIALRRALGTLLLCDDLPEMTGSSESSGELDLPDHASP